MTSALVTGHTGRCGKTPADEAGKPREATKYGIVVQDMTQYGKTA
jgi:hypothetical protein